MERSSQESIWSRKIYNNKKFKKTKISTIRAVIMFMQTKYNDPGSNLSLQTFAYKVFIFYFFSQPDAGWLGPGADSFWTKVKDSSTNSLILAARRRHSTGANLHKLNRNLAR